MLTYSIPASVDVIVGTCVGDVPVSVRVYVPAFLTSFGDPLALDHDVT